MENTLFDRTFRDSNGNIVIAQPPNPPLLIWFVATLSKLFLTTGTINTGLDIIAFTSLVVWSLLEVFQGVNYFRKGLGLVVLVAVIISRIAQMQIA